MALLDFFIAEVSSQASEREIDPRLLIDCVDLTSLNDNDDEEVIATLCQHAKKAGVAAVCVYPQFVKMVKELLTDTSIKIATVANFPKGQTKTLTVLKAIDQALLDGADEIDVVIPYQHYLQQNDDHALKDFVYACKQEMNESCLKTILESGAFASLEQLERAAMVCLEGGSNFLKTSTGKIPQGANLNAAAIMLGAIQSFGDLSRGFKASGGVRQYTQAKEYYLLAQIMMGEHWSTPKTFRLGASSLLQDLTLQAM